jgi:hypothetical protein
MPHYRFGLLLLNPPQPHLDMAAGKKLVRLKPGHMSPSLESCSEQFNPRIYSSLLQKTRLEHEANAVDLAVDFMVTAAEADVRGLGAFLEGD